LLTIQHPDNTTTTFTYDADGNQTSKVEPGGTTTYQYDYENRLKRVTLPSGPTNEMTYNGDGRRVQKVESAGTIKFLYDVDRVIQERDASLVKLADYVTEHGTLLRPLHALKRSGEWRYYHGDRLGSIGLLSDTGQVVTDTYGYEAFGSLVRSSGSTINPYRFGGQFAYHWEKDTLLFSLYRRYYEPRTARFMSRDLARRVSHMYAYADNNPLTRVDPSGCDAIQIPQPASLWCGVGTCGVNFGYGNYCGPTSGFWGGSASVAPIDTLDACCQNHDMCYANHGLNWTHYFRCLRGKKKKAKDDCDKMLCDCIAPLVATTQTQLTVLQAIRSIFGCP